MLSGEPGVRRFQAGRDAKYNNPYGPSRPEEQQPHDVEEGQQTHGTGQAEGKTPTRVDTAEEDSSPEHQGYLEQLLQDAAQELEEQQPGQQVLQPLPELDPDLALPADAEQADGDNQEGAEQQVQDEGNTNNQNQKENGGDNQEQGDYADDSAEDDRSSDDPDS